MVIHDRSYSRWKGDRAAPVAAASVILQAGLRRGVATLFRRKLPAIILILAAYGPFLFGLGFIFVRFYILSRAADFGEVAQVFEQAEVAEMTQVNGENIWFYLFMMQWPFVLLVCVLLGSGLIAEDRRANALELYLSRPVSVRQYLLGKFATIATFIAAVTVVPALILILAQVSVAWGEGLGEVWRLLLMMLRTVAAGALWVGVPALLILTASSLTQKARNAAILWMAVVIMLEFVASNILIEIFRNDSFFLMQIGFNIRQLGAWILGNTNPKDFEVDVPLWQSAAVLAGWCLLCIRTLHRRVRPVEVVA
jgi:ABC-type transport system involved in multi-copper enzyme maturation permease subunit